MPSSARQTKIWAVGWHVDNMPYYHDELDVLQKGRVIEKVPGQCIIRGVLHHIICYKWPLYRDGKIIGLMGLFFDTDAMQEENSADARLSYVDPLTGLMNHQGLLDALMRYEEQDQIHGKPYSLLLISNRCNRRIARSYGEKTLNILIRKEAEQLRILAGEDSTLARVTQSTFAVLRYKEKNGKTEALARKILQEFEGIHQIEGNPITVTIKYSLVHSDDPGISGHSIYAKAVEQLQAE